MSSQRSKQAAAPLIGYSKPLEPARASLSRAYDAVQEKYGDAVGSAETYVQRSPGKTVAYAVAIGAVIGLVAGVILGQGKSELGSDESA